MKKMNKTIAVKDHLERIGEITSMEAINLFGATRLSSIIYNLRHNYDMDIKNKTNVMKDRFGRLITYDTYYLEKK
jgi:hypothetical protein